MVRGKLEKWGSGEANRRFWEDDNKAPLPEEARQRLAEWTPEQIRAAAREWWQEPVSAILRPKSG